MGGPDSSSSARRRRRAVGPVASPGPPASGAAVPGWPDTGWLDPTEAPPSDDDDRLQQDVPPHHGG